MDYRQGDILLIPYPYTDLSDSKQRPVVVISKDSINDSILIVAKITSVIRNDDLSFFIDENATLAQMPKDSEVRTNELFTVHVSIIRRKLNEFKPLILRLFAQNYVQYLPATRKLKKRLVVSGFLPVRRVCV